MTAHRTSSGRRTRPGTAGNGAPRARCLVNGYPYRGPRYAAMQATRDKGRTYRWHVLPMPLSRGDVAPDGGIRAGSAEQFTGPFAKQRALRRARKISRRTAR